ncbi:MAG: hypothetical protein JWN52_4392 [Actinomycetia bacterium]|nr:hypothetical protein [Actinomycetes bacterium]
MDELTLLADMRKDVPPDTRYPAAHRALMAEIAGGVPTSLQRIRQRARRPILISVVLAGAVAAGTIVAVNSGNERHAPPRAFPVTTAPPLRLVAVTSPMALAANATSVAQRTPVPAATQWVYVKQESTISHAPPSGAMAQVPGSHQTKETWTRVDVLYVASVQHGKTVVTSTHGGMGDPIGWPAISYSYLNSLPTDPNALLGLMRHTLASFPGLYKGKVTDNDIFDSVIALMENYPVLPARLNAALYGILAQLKVVHLEQASDIAGRKVLSLYQIQDGMKRAIFINPTSYAYAGQKIIMVADRTSHDLGGTVTSHRKVPSPQESSLTLHKGEVLNDEAILVSKIVNAPGVRS